MEKSVPFLFETINQNAHMTELTKKEKIKRLRKLMWENIKKNFIESIIERRSYIIGLCSIYRNLNDNLHRSQLRHDIPEILDSRMDKFCIDGYWWTIDGFEAWWSRHWAIVRTIWKLKRSL